MEKSDKKASLQAILEAIRGRYRQMAQADKSGRPDEICAVDRQHDMYILRRLLHITRFQPKETQANLKTGSVVIDLKI